MTKSLLIVTMTFLLPLASWSECVQVSDRNLQLSDQDSVVPAIKWRARFENTCDAGVDATLSIALLDDNEETIYTLSAVESFEQREKRTVEKEVYVPGRVAEKAVAIKVEKVERTRD